MFFACVCALWGTKGWNWGRLMQKKKKEREIEREKEVKHSQLEYEENEACGLGCFSNQWFCDTFKFLYARYMPDEDETNSFVSV